MENSMDPKYKDIGDIETRVIEECSEVIQALCKVQRFGWDNFNPLTNQSNLGKVWDEIQDLENVLSELKDKIWELDY